MQQYVVAVLHLFIAILLPIIKTKRCHRRQLFGRQDYIQSFDGHRNAEPADAASYFQVYSQLPPSCLPVAHAYRLHTDHNRMSAYTDLSCCVHCIAGKVGCLQQSDRDVAAVGMEFCRSRSIPQTRRNNSSNCKKSFLRRRT